MSKQAQCVFEADVSYQTANSTLDASLFFSSSCSLDRVRWLASEESPDAFGEGNESDCITGSRNAVKKGIWRLPKTQYSEYSCVERLSVEVPSVPSTIWVVQRTAVDHDGRKDE